MKKTQSRIIAASAEPMTGSPSSAYGGIDVSVLYIDMLCEKFRDRGIKKGTLNPAKRAEIEKNAKLLGFGDNEVSAHDDKYRTLVIDGKAYMSCNDFAAYYKDLRGNKLSSLVTRAENEYKKAEADEKNVQESGKPPKKAMWLTVIRSTKKESLRLVDEFVLDEYRSHAKEDVIEGKQTGMPGGVIPAIAAVTLSLLLIVCSSVMVSRASAQVSSLENEIDELTEIKKDLVCDLEMKNNMIYIKETAVEEYGMISGDYAASRYIDLTEDEKLESFENNEKGESLLSRILRAIGLK